MSVGYGAELERERQWCRVADWAWDRWGVSRETLSNRRFLSFVAARIGGPERSDMRATRRAHVKLRGAFLGIDRGVERRAPLEEAVRVISGQQRLETSGELLLFSE